MSGQVIITSVSALEPYLGELVQISPLDTLANTLRVSGDISGVLRSDETDFNKIKKIFKQWLSTIKYPTWELLCNTLDDDKNLRYRKVVLQMRKDYHIPDKVIRSFEDLREFCEELKDHLVPFATCLRTYNELSRYIRESDDDSNAKLEKIFQCWFDQTEKHPWDRFCELLHEHEVFHEVARKMLTDHA